MCIFICNFFFGVVAAIFVFFGFSCFDVGTTGPLKSTLFTFYQLLLWVSRGLFSKNVSPEYIQDTFRYEGVQIEARGVFCRPVLGFKPLIFVFSLFAAAL